MTQPKTINLTMRLSPAANAELERMATELESNKTDAIRRALLLLDLAIEARNEGKRIGIADANRNFESEIVVFKAPKR